MGMTGSRTCNFLVPSQLSYPLWHSHQVEGETVRPSPVGWIKHKFQPKKTNGTFSWWKCKNTPTVTFPEDKIFWFAQFICCGYFYENIWAFFFNYCYQYYYSYWLFYTWKTPWFWVGKICVLLLYQWFKLYLLTICLASPSKWVSEWVPGIYSFLNCYSPN